MQHRSAFHAELEKTVQTWARLIERAEVPNPFSSRDGKLLRGVPPELHLNVEEVASKLGDAIESRLLSDSSELLTQAWIAGMDPLTPVPTAFKLLFGSIPPIIQKRIYLGLLLRPTLAIHTEAYQDAC